MPALNFRTISKVPLVKRLYSNTPDVIFTCILGGVSVAIAAYTFITCRDNRHPLHTHRYRYEYTVKRVEDVPEKERSLPYYN